MLRLALAGLPRILAEPDVDPIAVLLGGVAQQLLDIAPACRSTPPTGCACPWLAAEMKGILLS
jgi:hypothetical protein